MGAGESDPVQFTWTNNGSGTIYNITTPTVVSQTGGTFGSAGGTCTTVTTLAPHASCTFTGTFTTTTPSTPVTLIVGFNYAGGTNVAQQTVTAANSSVLVTGVATVPLPTPTMGAGEADPVEFTWTNNGSGTINLITPPTVVSEVGGTFSGAGGTCTTVTSLAPHASCVLTGTFTSGAPSNPVSLTVGFNYSGGTNVAQVTTATKSQILVTGSATTPLPAPMGAGEQQPFTFTFTNTGSGTALGFTGFNVTPTGGTTTVFTPAPTSTCAANFPLASGATCTITGTFSSGVVCNTSGCYNLSATITYAGGTTDPATSPSSGPQLLVKVINNTFSPKLPATIGTGEVHPVTVTYTNTGTGTAYGIQDFASASNFTLSDGMCNAGPTESCSGFPITLASGATCSVSCNFQVNTTTAPVITSTATYAGGTTAPVTTTTSASPLVKASVLQGLPASTGAGTSYPVVFSFFNSGSASVSGASTSPLITVTPGPTSQLDAPVPVNCTATLTSGQTCQVSVNFTPAAASTAYTVSAFYNYTGGPAVPNPVTTSTTTHAFARKLTINNYCGKDVWFSFNGAPARKGCSDKNPCARGSTCNKDADDGKGICYFTNPLPAEGGLHLGPMTELKPTTASIFVPDLGVNNTTIWSGSIAGRTGCSGKSCETADCNSSGGDKSCPPGNNFSSPATLGELTLNRSVEDKYSIQVGNGINLSMSIGPTNPDKTTPAYNSSNPYYCATPGSADASRIFNACSWMLTPPAYPKASSAVDYVWVKPGMGGACSTNACSGSEVCGLSFGDGKFAKVCGKQIGYWTASQACLLNAVGASSYFDCKAAMTQPAGEVLQDLNACTNASPQSGSSLPQTCTSSANKEIAAMVQWIKSACPSVSAFVGDTVNSSFTCKTDEPEPKTKTKSKVKVKMNVTEYTITFCPEMAPNSPFRNVRGTASNP